MNSNIKDLESVIQFSEQIKRFNAGLASEFQEMNARVRQLSENWDDKQYQSFVADFDEVARGVRAYLERADNHERYLERIIERTRNLLDTHL